MTAPFTAELLMLAFTETALLASVAWDEDGEFVADDDHPVSITTGCITCIIADYLLTVLKSDRLYLSSDLCDQLAVVPLYY